MAVSVKMPQLGESVTEGTVTRWLKQEGERVEVDEPLLEVSTDKVDTEVPSPVAGILQSIKVAEDETVEIGVELAIIGDDSDDAGDGAGDDSGAASAGGDSDGGDAGAPAAAESAPEPETAPEPEAAPEATPESAQAGVSSDDAETYGDEAPLEDEPEAAPAAAPSTPAPAAAAPAAAAPAAPAPASSSSDDDDVNDAYVTPLVRKLASENGVDLATVTGTGVGGRIRKSDVLAAAGNRPAAAAPAAPAAAAATPPPPATTAAAPPAPAPAQPAAAASPAPAPSAPAARPAAPALAGDRVEKLSRRRALIANRMIESLQTSAQLTTVIEVDVTKIARLRDQAKAGFLAREGVKLSFLPFFALAAIEALKAHPIVNSSIDTTAGTVTYHGGINLGIAVDTETGLIVPVVQGAGDLNIGGIARKIADLADRTRTNKISPDELSGGTFTLTNTGSRGALFDTPIFTPPQVAILGTGAVVKRAVVISDANIGETIAVRSMVYLALSYDHQIVDGADAARFLGTIKERLEAGKFEASLGLS